MGMGGAYSRPASSPWLKHQAAVHVVTARPVTTWMVRGGETTVFWRRCGERLQEARASFLPEIYLSIYLSTAEPKEQPWLPRWSPESHRAQAGGRLEPLRPALPLPERRLRPWRPTFVFVRADGGLATAHHTSSSVILPPRLTPTSAGLR